MSIDTVLITEVDGSYTEWRCLCPICLYDWDETTHSLWNVGALTCDSCGATLAVPDADFHGDANGAHDT